MFGETRGVARHVVGEHADLFVGTQGHEDKVVGHGIGVLENDAHGLAGFHAEFARGELHLIGDGLHAQGVGIGGVGFFPGGGHGCERGGVGRETRARDGLPEWIVNEHGRRGVAQAAVGDLDGVQTGGELEGDLLLRAVGAVGGGELDAVGGDIEEAVFDAEDGGLGCRRVNECSIRAAGGGGRFPFLFRGVLGDGRWFVGGRGAEGQPVIDARSRRNFQHGNGTPFEGLGAGAEIGEHLLHGGLGGVQMRDDGVEFGARRTEVGDGVDSGHAHARMRIGGGLREARHRVGHECDGQTDELRRGRAHEWIFGAGED